MKRTIGFKLIVTVLITLLITSIPSIAYASTNVTLDGRVWTVEVITNPEDYKESVIGGGSWSATFKMTQATGGFFESSVPISTTSSLDNVRVISSELLDGRRTSQVTYEADWWLLPWDRPARIRVVVEYYRKL